MPTPHNSLRRALFSMLAYFDMFDFPPTKEESIKFLHSSTRISNQNIETILSKTPHIRVQNRLFYFLPTRKKLVEKRMEKEKISERKLQKATKLIKILGLLPTISFIGISGSLAMKNGDEGSDIDLFIISIPNTVWITRFFIWVLLALAFRRRKRNTKGQDSLCINMLVDRNAVVFFKKRQDIYTAHEIIQVMPIVDKYQTFALFLQKNTWVLEYLANSFEEKETSDNMPFWIEILSFCLVPLENALRLFQLWYMKKHQTIEQTTPTFIAFHPHNYRDTIIKEFGKRRKIYGI